MKSVRLLTVLGLALLTLCGQSVAAEPSHEFIGAKKCSICHKMPAQGEQYKIWVASAHSKAFDTLGSDKAKSLGATVGVQDPQNSPQCLKCHSTAYYFTEKKITEKIDFQEGVSCESCHGPGADYAKKSVMKDKELAIQNGLLVPDEKTCRQCHGAGGPAPKIFDFKEFWAKIMHPRPAK